MTQTKHVPNYNCYKDKYIFIGAQSVVTCLFQLQQLKNFPTTFNMYLQRSLASRVLDL